MRSGPRRGAVDRLLDELGRIHRAPIIPILDGSILVRQAFGRSGTFHRGGRGSLFSLSVHRPRVRLLRPGFQPDVELIRQPHRIGRRRLDAKQRLTVGPQLVRDLAHHLGQDQRVGIRRRHEQQTVHRQFARGHAVIQGTGLHRLARQLRQILSQARIIPTQAPLDPRIFQEHPEVSDQQGLGIEGKHLSQ